MVYINCTEDYARIMPNGKCRKINPLEIHPYKNGNDLWNLSHKY